MRGVGQAMPEMSQGLPFGAGPASLSFEPLTPLQFLERSARVFPDKTGIVDGDLRLTYADFRERAARLAGSLRALGVEPGDRVAVLAPNSSLLLISHYAVPAGGGVLVALNVRLHAAELGRILAHAAPDVLLCDNSLLELGEVAVELSGLPVRLLVDSGPGGEVHALMTAGEPLEPAVDDERSLLSLNYTSGTTGDPKGVMYHHRGAFLQSLAMVVHARLDAASRFLWTLPMFHCNGWCFTWAVTAVSGTHVCLRKVEEAEIWRLIETEEVTHLNAAPTLLVMIAGDAPRGRRAPRRVHVCTGGAPPTPALIASLSALNLDVTHLYGLTETFGPIVVCQPQPTWSDVAPGTLARLVVRQGVGNVIAFPPRVVDERGADVPMDGETIGEIVLRGNNLMLGYYREPALTRAAVIDGWFMTGDLAVVHPDGYIEIRDRAKDIIVSGGENIASVEVEQALASHPAVLEAAVVAAPDEHWGEIAVAFVTLNGAADPPTEEELIHHVRQQLARYKAPKRVIFGPLPKTGTGKIQKFALRERLRAGASVPVDP
jgi:fatty-acyl-CoA synthase